MVFFIFVLLCACGQTVILNTSALCVASFSIVYLSLQSPTVFSLAISDLPFSGSTLGIFILECHAAYSDFLFQDLMSINEAKLDLILPIISLIIGRRMLRRFYLIRYSPQITLWCFLATAYLIAFTFIISILILLLSGIMEPISSWLDFIFDTQSVGDLINDQFRLSKGFSAVNALFVFSVIVFIWFSYSLVVRLCGYLILGLFFYLGLGVWMLGVIMVGFVESFYILRFLFKEYA